MPPDQEQRDIRQTEILSLLQSHNVRNQGDLVDLLEQKGIKATQSSISRDLRALGVGWIGGRYTLPAEHDERDPGVSEISHFLRAMRPAGAHLTVILTMAGAAQAVGLAIDRAGWPEVVGTMAGDDTVFAATASARDQRRLLRRLEAFLEHQKER